MKHPPLYTLILLVVFLHYGSSSDSDDQCVPLFVTVGETATINCRYITKKDQDGVYLYRQRDEKSREETMSYYFKDGTFTPEKNFKGRLETNKDLRNFSVFMKNVSEHDGGVYWCQFNQHDVNTISQRTCLLVQSGIILIYKEETKLNHFIFWGVIGGLSFIILVLLIVLCYKQCYGRGHYTQTQQPSSNGVYEVMRGHTRKALINPAYESTRR
ncbi:uncharacterized protein LOC132845060 isoform X2 [Tachysurus vachellii]|uniref:uncharacterized protein LOC132845060 isoform X2 n=1 Tax=Tachysurus vachellii TaxID=175792 RepID=UPI00296A9976|nr:uncharacterized protein LOC132845060 isoform X2 [Tachysurus vachellii]